MPFRTHPGWWDACNAGVTHLENTVIPRCMRGSAHRMRICWSLEEQTGCCKKHFNDCGWEDLRAFHRRSRAGNTFKASVIAKASSSWKIMQARSRLKIQMGPRIHLGIKQNGFSTASWRSSQSYSCPSKIASRYSALSMAVTCRIPVILEPSNRNVR